VEEDTILGERDKYMLARDERYSSTFEMSSGAFILGFTRMKLKEQRQLNEPMGKQNMKV
jgi:hypothetical protein